MTYVAAYTKPCTNVFHNSLGPEDKLRFLWNYFPASSLACLPLLGSPSLLRSWPFQSPLLHHWLSVYAVISPARSLQTGSILVCIFRQALVSAVWNLDHRCLKFWPSLLGLIMLTELNEQNKVFIHLLIFAAAFFPAHVSKTTFGCHPWAVWQIHHGYFLVRWIPVLLGLGKEKPHIGTRDPLMWLVSGSRGPTPGFDTEADTRVLFIRDSRKDSVVLLVGECILLCSLLCWDLPWKMPLQ